MLKRLPEFVSELVACASVNEQTEILAGLIAKYPDILGALTIYAVSFSEQPTTAPKARTLTPITPEFAKSMQASAEKLNKMVPITIALAEKFGRQPSEFSLVAVKHNGPAKLAVTLTATEGIDLGDPAKPFDFRRSWRSATSLENRDRFVITPENGVEIDTREAITLPLLSEIANVNHEINEWVWLTGEQDIVKTNPGVPIAYMLGGEVVSTWHRDRYHHQNIRFRPAVIIE